MAYLQPQVMQPELLLIKLGHCLALGDDLVSGSARDMLCCICFGTYKATPCSQHGSPASNLMSHTILNARMACMTSFT